MRLVARLARLFGIHVYPLQSAMHGAAEFHTKRWGYLCFKPPTYSFGCWWPAYLYVSPDATPGMSTFYLGRGGERWDAGNVRDRRRRYGHNFDTRPEYEARGVVYSDE